MVSLDSVIGDLAHQVLETAVRRQLWSSPTWRTEMEAIWEADLARAVALLSRAGNPASEMSPTSWAGYELKRARAFTAFQSLAQRLREISNRAEILTEVDLASSDGHLRGRADLVIRGPDSHLIIDYKTGTITNPSGDVKINYKQQLQLYAYLEMQQTGAWPDAAILIPLDGPEVRVDICPADCERLAAEAEQRLAAYVSFGDEKQPASPSAGHCRMCPYTGVCDAFWSVVDDSWQPDLLAVDGEILSITRGALPVASLSVRAYAGSCGSEEVTIRRIDLLQHPIVASLQPGDRIRLIGLRFEPARRTFAAPLWARISIVSHTSNR